jgi:hypothetical protein
MKDSTLNRLRAANPVPAPPARQDDDLFNRIVATPSGRDARKTSRTRRSRPRVVFAVALGSAVLAASTALAVSSLTGGTIVKPPVTLREYRLAQRRLPLPPGQTWPKLPVDRNSVTTRGAGGGHAVLISQVRWECYWVQAIRTGDAPAQEQAKTVLAGLLAHNILVAPPGAPEDYIPPNPPKVPFVVMADDGGKQFMQRTYDEALAGHPQQLIQSCRANR